MQYGLPGPDDREAVAELFHEDMVDLGVDVTLEQLEQLAGRVIEDVHSDQPGCTCWVARPSDDEPPCGVVLANFNWSLKFGGKALWIEELYVTSDFRRLGVGRELVGLVVDFAEEKGFHGIDLEAYQGNTPASILYRTMGFHRLGRERFYYRMGEEEYL
jgi:ribosomal protein S18 acetylase RimI-like enzyme